MYGVLLCWVEMGWDWLGWEGMEKHGKGKERREEKSKLMAQLKVSENKVEETR